MEKDLPACPKDHVLVPDTAVGYLCNASMPEHHLTYLKSKTADEVLTGSIEPVSDWNQVKVLIPIFVVEQNNGNNIKLRVIFDGRALNTYLREATGAIKYESVRDVLLHRARVCTKLDLSAAFRHVQVTDEQKPLLGIVVDGKLFRYTCLPFGLSWSPALYLATLKPAIDAIRKIGIKIVWYVDDFLVLADSKEELDAALARVLQILAAHGWHAAPDKTYCNAYTTIPFLGLLVVINDDNSIELRIPRTKRDKLLDSLSTFIKQGTTTVHELQKALGRLSFMRIVLPEIGFCRATLDSAVATMSSEGRGPVSSRQVHVIGRLREDVLGLHALLQDDSVLLRKATNPTDSSALHNHIIFSDASASGWGVLLVDPNGPFSVPPKIAVDMIDNAVIDTRGWTATGVFSPAECALSSAAREIWAVVLGIRRLNLSNCRISWHSDSTCAVAAISKWASSALGVADALSELWGEVTRRRIDINLNHVHRELSLMPVADYLSRRGWRDRQAEWAFSPADVSAVLASFRHHCDADLFASERNHRFDYFCSQFLEDGSRGDAFYTPWWGRRWWAFPPISLRGRVLQRLVAYSRRARAAAAAESSSSSARSSLSPSPQTRRHQPLHLSVVLVTTQISPLDPDAALFEELRPNIIRSITLFVPNSSPASLLLPTLRLIGDTGRPAPDPPPWRLNAHLISITERHVL